LALLGRLPSAHVDGDVMQASEKPAQEPIRDEPVSDEQQTRPDDGDRGDAHVTTPSRPREEGQQREPEQREHGGQCIVPDANCIEANDKHHE
jgi:hypothetical protein